MRIRFCARFQAPANLHAVLLNQGLTGAGDAVSVWIADRTGREWRHGRIEGALPSAPLLLAFPAFVHAFPSDCHLFITEPADAPPDLPAALREKMPLAAPPIPLGTPESAVPLPPLPPHGIFLLDDGRVVPGNRVPAAIGVTADYGSYWRDQYGAHLSGWTHCTRVPIERLFLVLGAAEAELELTPFPEVVQHYPECGEVMPVRWHGYVSGPPGEPLCLRVQTPAGVRTVEPRLPERLTRAPEPDPAVPELQWRFVRAVNEGRLSVLEIGGRLVSPGAIDWRREMHGARGYLGFDVHPAPTVDIVGDAHLLTNTLAPGSIDAVWSSAVFEHLRMPWLVAAEINRVLRMGGLVFTQAPQAWPVHESPADYWRFSDEGLKLLFGPEFGFEIIDSAVAEPIAMLHRRRDYPYDEMPLHPGYGKAMVLARKVAELPAPAGLEAMQRGFIGRSGQLYPKSDRERFEHARGG